MSLPPPGRFAWSDAWVLGAVALGGGERGAGLREIIEAGDVINRAIFTPRQLRRGLARLIAARHVVQHGNQFVTAGDALLTARRLSLHSPSSFDVLQHFEEFLEAEPFPAGEDDPGDFHLDGVSDGEVEAACETHRTQLKSFRREAAAKDS